MWSRSRGICATWPRLLSAFHGSRRQQRRLCPPTVLSRLKHIHIQTQPSCTDITSIHPKTCTECMLILKRNCALLNKRIIIVIVRVVNINMHIWYLLVGQLFFFTTVTILIKKSSWRRFIFRLTWRWYRRFSKMQCSCFPNVVTSFWQSGNY